MNKKYKVFSVSLPQNVTTTSTKDRSFTIYKILCENPYATCTGDCERCNDKRVIRRSSYHIS